MLFDIHAYAEVSGSAGTFKSVAKGGKSKAMAKSSTQRTTKNVAKSGSVKPPKESTQRGFKTYRSYNGAVKGVTALLSKLGDKGKLTIRDPEMLSKNNKDRGKNVKLYNTSTIEKHGAGKYSNTLETYLSSGGGPFKKVYSKTTRSGAQILNDNRAAEFVVGTMGRTFKVVK